MRRNRARLLLAGVCLWLLAVALAPGLGLLAPVGWLDGQAENLWFQLRGERSLSDRVVIVAIDDAAFDELPLPTVYWGGYYAEALRRLARTGASAVALDVFFAELPQLPETATAAELELKRQELAQYTELGTALAEARFVHDCPALLAAYLEDGGLKPPREEVVAGAGGGTETLGAINLLASGARDEVVRDFAVGWPSLTPDGPGVSSLPSLGAQYILTGELGPAYTFTQAPELLRINYAGPAGTIPRVSLARILAAGPEELEKLSAQWTGKLVFIGDTALPQDTHLTPYSRCGFSVQGLARMPGVEVLANVADTMILDRELSTPPPLKLFALAAVVLAVSGLAIYLWPWFGSLVADLILAGGVAMYGYHQFQADQVVPVGMLLVLLVVHGSLARLLRYILLERERRRLADYFCRYTSSEALKLVIDDEQRRLLEGERCEVVVMFYDIRGFTTMSENAEPAETITYLTRFHDRMSGIIAAHDGWVDKFLGDGALVLFGFPLQSAGAPSRAVLCACELVAAAAEFAPLSGAGRLAIGVGMNYGPVVVGNIGSATKLDFTAVGDTVNTAARVQDLCKKHGRPLLLTGALAAMLAAGEFELESLGSAEIRGRSAEQLFSVRVETAPEE